MPTESSSTPSLVLFAASVAATLALTATSRRRTEKNQYETDKYYLDLAQEYRLKLKAPQQSHFRVVALLLLEDNSTIYGTNDEPSPNITLAMCAERCAFLQYRAQQYQRPVKTVYIVTDANTQVSPGTACREFMYGHPATTPQTRVVLQSQDPMSEFSSYTLAELIPYPPIFAGMPPEQQLEFGITHQASITQQAKAVQAPGLDSASLQKLLDAATTATRLESRESVHAVQYGAAAAIQIGDDTEIFHATQVKALEYSSTQDAVCQMSSRILQAIRENPSSRVLAAVQVDQFGIPHSLFAPARAFLVEHGFGDAQVVLTALEGETETPTITVKAVPARALSPLIPEFRT